MPLKLHPPRKGKSPNWSIRGTYLKVYVDRSCGTPRRSVARSKLTDLERQIEAGEYPDREAPASREQPTFLSATVAYMKARHTARRTQWFLKKLIRHFGETPLLDIDQAAIDAAALELYPAGSAGTRNAFVYTPVSAILHHANVDIKLRRPKGAKGRVVTDWISLEDARAIIAGADGVDAEFGLLLRFLLFTGIRLGEALKLRWQDVRLEEAKVWVRREKSGAASDVRLRQDLLEAMTAHAPEAPEPHRRVFRFHQGGRLRHRLVRAKLAALGMPCPVQRPVKWVAPPCRLAWVNFHSFRHTWASWMRRHAGADVQGLVATGNWRDARSAARYSHAVARDEWDRVDALPSVEKTGRVA